MAHHFAARLFGAKDRGTEKPSAELHPLVRKSATEWHIEPYNGMRAPGIIFATEDLIRAMGDQIHRQIVQIAALPGIAKAVYAMPDACSGYGFPRGGITAFDPEQGGVVASGGIGFDIGWGVRTLRTHLTVAELLPQREALADRLCAVIPSGAAARSLRLTPRGMDAMLLGGAGWAVKMGYGFPDDLERIEDQGFMADADPGQVSAFAKTRQRDEMGILGSGNYLIVQRVAQIYDAGVAETLGIRLDDIQISIHCGSRGLGQQIGTDAHHRMAAAASSHGITFPNRDLACAPLDSKTGRHYLGAMRAGVNCALANRQMLAHLVGQTFKRFFPETGIETLCDVSYNACRVETHVVDGQARTLYVHRKGASRALEPGHHDLPAAWRDTGQPGLIGGAMNAPAYITVGTAAGQQHAFGSSCHGRGPALNPGGIAGPESVVEGQEVVQRLGTLIRGPSLRGVLVKETPETRQDANAVVDAAEQAGLARRVARLEPLIYIRG